MIARRTWITWITALCLALALALPAIALADDDDVDGGGNGSSGNGTGEVSFGDDDGDDDDNSGSGSGSDDDDSDDGGNSSSSGSGGSSDGEGGNGASHGSGSTDDDVWGDGSNGTGGNGSNGSSGTGGNETGAIATCDDADTASGDGGNGPGSGDDDDDDGGNATSGGNGTGGAAICVEFDDDDFDEALPNQAIVQLRTGVDANAFAGRYDVSVVRVLPSPNIALLELDADLDDDDELNEILRDADVLWGEENYTSQAPEGRPRYFFTSSEGLPRIVDGPALPAGLEFTPAAACSTGAAVLVAVLDTGVDLSHPALAGNLLSNGVNMVDVTLGVSDTGNGIDDDSDGQVDEMVGHGTHVAGSILQVAPDALILPVKVLNSDGVGDSFSVMAGIVYAVEEGAQVINLSLGSTYDSRAIEGAVDFAANRGVVVLAAAGNAGREVPVEYPAAYSGVISVAATTAAADKTDYSNYHQTVDISAPGNELASAYPDGRYTTASGTSMSAPLVAGAAALILELQPGIQPAQVEELIMSSSGPLQLSNPAFTGKLGAGELNIDSSLSCAIGS